MLATTALVWTQKLALATTALARTQTPVLATTVLICTQKLALATTVSLNCRKDVFSVFIINSGGGNGESALVSYKLQDVFIFSVNLTERK